MPLEFVSREPLLANQLKAGHEKRKAMRAQMLGQARVGQLGRNVDALYEWGLDWMADVGRQMRSRESMVGALSSLGYSGVLGRVGKIFPGLQRALYGER